MIGAVITSCQSKAYFSSGSYTAELRSLYSAFEEAISDLFWTENIADIFIETERSHIDPVFEKRFTGSSSTGFGKSLIFQLFVD